MNDYLSTLALRAVRPAETLQPRQPGMFEPAAGGLGEGPLTRSFGAEDGEEAAMMPPGANVVSTAAARAMSPRWRVDQILPPAAAPMDAGRNDDDAGVMPARKRLGEMAAEDTPDRKGSRRTAGFFRSHDISMGLDDGAGAARDTAGNSRDEIAAAPVNRGNAVRTMDPLMEPERVMQTEERSLLQPPSRPGRTSVEMRERSAPAVPPLRHDGPETAAAPDVPGRSGIGTLRGGEAFSGAMDRMFGRSNEVTYGLPERRLMPAPMPETAGPVPARSEPPVVRVTIGRIEVRAVMQQQQRPEPPARKREPRLSLDEYLRSQKGGGR